MCRSIEAKNFRNDITVINQSIENTVFTKKYDIIILKQVLHHIVDKEYVMKKLYAALNEDGIVLLMFPNEKYQSCVIPFKKKDDLLGRINSEIMDNYTKDLGFKIDFIKNVSNKAYFENVYNYLMFMYSIGSLQKLFFYREEDYIPILKMIDIYKNLFVNTGVVEVEFSYCYLVLKK